MPAASSSALALAARLRALDDDALLRLLREREVRSAGLRDWFDLAEALLDRPSVQRALEGLDRHALAVLAGAAELSAAGRAPTVEQLAERIGSASTEVRRRAAVLAELGLAAVESDRVAPWDGVAEQLAAWPSFDLPSADELIWTPAPGALVPVSDADRDAVDRLAGERAFAATGRVTELVAELQREPARRLAKGGIALPETRRLAASIGAEQDDLTPLLDLAERAELVGDDGAALAVTAAGAEWLGLDDAERWSTLAAAWIARLAPDVRRLLEERAAAEWDDGLLQYLAWFYPGSAERMLRRVESARAHARLLGITIDATPSGPGRALLIDGVAAARERVAALFPAHVEQVYLQHDLTIIAPGPLRADLDGRLRSMADVEARGLASTYRITAASLGRALARGETDETIRDFLAGISLTGVPQPLDYLIRDTAERFGALRVGAIAEADRGADAGARSYVRSDDPALLRQLTVDSALGSLALIHSGEHRAVSRVEASVLFWSIVDARYPAVLEDATGVIQPVSRRTTVAPAAGGARRDPAVELVKRLRESGAATSGATGSDDETGGAAWIARQLELAAKGRTPVVVTVRMPDGSDVELRLEPASVAGGRLRARDARADLERTLPLSSITSVVPLD
ncbi:hypothetical protein GCM10027515_30270 [Schumannella luteola]|uniref:Helicase XPB/Ssl2 N-terminal domain-containing protein n=1 Tax=Schumannella luteola TaxID=472059 RepID=A0A852YBG7_9MICO|nr:helicase-associated domain-containing protein [Schumannella luteola]NYG99172.1 hypothetical protein [Schumannella luteola]TPX03703.1 hypothetical protein FJ656_15750 [Schumannella luteola]